ncbi:hypothetical protein GGS23DRAFT_618812 [Durotheca rogersii]|uniref:uncharacterized protein n=1 Tax=Durotheca rogersii TaxID=419775 RepID=UPI00221F1049|nr:uncharacterized protein GGS23DRAFT_618812 [Durotheca rogersii]KAI5865656.1 hypothetical protein GGS23DRAFT_618812 [Durotheca rogersii]
MPLRDLEYLDFFNFDDDEDPRDETAEFPSSIDPRILGTTSISTTSTPLPSADPSFNLLGTNHLGEDAPFAQSMLGLDDPLPLQAPSPNTMDVSFDDFFRDNGAYRAPTPCAYCSRLRLQCLILQTTSVNPNPVRSCASCVALFRQCSLAERGKRLPAAFETAEPVVANLHGVREEEAEAPALPAGSDSAAQASRAALPSPAAKKPRSRSVRKTQALRTWFACHLDHPYPSEEEKAALTRQSGLSRTQVADWFSNARRRNRMARSTDRRVFPRGSPMPTPPKPLLGGMTPLERWRRSPPDQEPVSTSALERALGLPVGRFAAAPRSFDRACADADADAPPSSSSGAGSARDLRFDSPLQYPSSDSASSCHTYSSASERSFFSATSARAHPLSGRDAPQRPAAPPSAAASGAGAGARGRRGFPCTFCARVFAKKYDWRRHERSVHQVVAAEGGEAAPRPPQWVCRGAPLARGQAATMWRLGRREPECVFCGREAPPPDHVSAHHEFEACAAEPRSFARKDHLWQHLYKFHGCRKWDGWKPDLDMLRQD